MTVRKLTDLQESFGDVYQYAYFNSRLYFERFDIWVAETDGSDMHKIIGPSATGFSIVKDGTITYVNNSGYVDAVIDKTHSTTWTADINENNKKPLIYNHY